MDLSSLVKEAQRQGTQECCVAHQGSRLCFPAPLSLRVLSILKASSWTMRLLVLWPSDLYGKPEEGRNHLNHLSSIVLSYVPPKTSIPFSFARNLSQVVWPYLVVKDARKWSLVF